MKPHSFFRRHLAKACCATLLAAFIPAATAQSYAVARFRVPFAFEAGGKRVEAGRFQISRTSSNTIFLNGEGIRQSLVVKSLTIDSRTPPALQFQKYGDAWFLREVRLPSVATVLVLPRSSREKELARSASAGRSSRAEVVTIALNADSSGAVGGR